MMLVDVLVMEPRPVERFVHALLGPLVAIGIPLIAVNGRPAAMRAAVELRDIREPLARQELRPVVNQSTPRDAELPAGDEDEPFMARHVPEVAEMSLHLIAPGAARSPCTCDCT